MSRGSHPLQCVPAVHSVRPAATPLPHAWRISHRGSSFSPCCFVLPAMWMQEGAAHLCLPAVWMQEGAQVGAPRGMAGEKRGREEFEDDEDELPEEVKKRLAALKGEM